MSLRLTVAVLGTLLVAVPVVLLVVEHNTRAMQVESTALSSARAYARASHHFRQYYIDEVMPVAKAANLAVVMDAHAQPYSLPLAYTAAIDISNDAYSPEFGGSYFVSDQPWRQRRELTAAETRLWSDVKTAGQSTHTFVTVNERRWLLYAEPIFLNESFCVDCHNTHPDSPSTSWQLGDLRGAEVVKLAVGDSGSAISFSPISLLGLLAIAACTVALLAVESQRRRRVREQAGLIRTHQERLALFAAGVAHNFNNLLAVVLGNAELLALQAGKRPEIADIVTSAHRGKDLVDKLLGAVQDRTPRTKTVDLVETIGRLNGYWTSRAAKQNVHLTLDLPAECVVSWDADFFEFVAAELVDNALAHADALVAVRIIDEGCVCLVVENDFEHPPALERSVDPFFSTRGPDRAGLGLAAVNGMAESMGQRFSIQLEGDLVRATVTLGPEEPDPHTLNVASAGS